MISVIYCKREVESRQCRNGMSPMHSLRNL